MDPYQLIMRLFDGIDQAVIIHDGAHILHANQAAYLLFRYDGRELAQYSLVDWVESKSHPELERRIRKLRECPEEILPDVEYVFKRADGSRFVGRNRTRSFSWAHHALDQKYTVIFWSEIKLLREESTAP
jgi:PAS domain-containing protein